MDAKDFQLTWPEAEVSRLANKIQTDYRAALADHNMRIRRWREYYRRWRSRINIPQQAEETKSNVPVPYIRWNVFTKWAKEMDSLFGDDAEIVAVPVGPSNAARDTKIGKYMSWRVFNSMKLTNRFCAFVLRKILFGRSVAFSPWRKDTFTVPATEATEETKVVDYEGPDFVPLWPDDFIVPAEDVQSLHEFSFVVRRYRVTPEQLLKGEETGRYQNITKNWDRIVNLSQHGVQREFEGEEIKQEKDEAEGILYQRPLSSGEWLLVLEWYGRWRPLKKGKKDASEWDFKSREMHQQDFVVRYLWDLHTVIGVQNLADLYPLLKNRRPFVEASMVKDGSYWSPGMAEMLIDIEDELAVNHNQATEAGQLANSPAFGYRPNSGVDAEKFKLEPGLFIPVNNPATDIKQIEIHANMDVATWKEQVMLSYGERLTGMSDMALGRQSDRPNAPRTGVQTMALLEEGNVRVSLDVKVLREDMAEVLAHFWELEFMFANDETFFRVTEEDAGGLFQVNHGGAVLKTEDRDGRFDFRLQFANSIYSREAKKQQALARYQLDLQNPLIMQNPQALWEVTREAHEALGAPNFEQLVPKPPQPDAPMDPKTEWSMMLHGDDVFVNPLDNDQLHMLRHMRDLQQAELDPQHVDPEAVRTLADHYHQHMIQLHNKRVQQAIIEQAASAAQKLLQGAGAIPMPNGLFGGPVSQPPGNPAAAPPQLYSGHPEVMHEQ